MRISKTPTKGYLALTFEIKNREDTTKFAHDPVLQRKMKNTEYFNFVINKGKPHLEIYYSCLTLWSFKR